MKYKLGIDVGSTTLKTVILNEQDQIIEKSYQRHFSKVREMTLKHLRSLEDILSGEEIQVAVTGSAGLGIAKAAGLEFVQEVFATSGAVQRTYPDTDVVIELGGEDAKILFLQGAMEERMNGTCAGGTGAFIDQMATLMDLTPGELDELSLKHEKIYPIASRCGVFAKSDIQPLLNQGANKEDISASVYQSVVEQTIGGLAQGREIKGNVLFLGGPLFFLKGLQERFVETLELEPHQAHFPELAPYYVALGAAWQAEELGESSVVSYEKLLASLEGSIDNIEPIETYPPLFENQGEYDKFKARHNKVSVERNDISTYKGKAYLGIDAGSTTTKLTLIDENEAILYQHYVSNGGTPIPVIKDQLEKIYSLGGDRIEIASSAVTGYGEELIASAFGIDIGLVETMAHFTAAKHFYPEVDFIIDIGGQDIKCFTIKDGTVDSVILNEACSSGCGSFLETFAKSLGYPVEEFANLALFAKNPVDLGSRCTVFMNSSVKQAQKDGATVGDISAGLAMSVIKNALYKVIRARSADDLGNHVVVQGGTFLNEAVLRSFELELGKEVIRPEVSELMGAYGAALYAREHVPATSTIIDSKGLQGFYHKSVAANCKRCTNNCAITVNTFADGSRFISGNKCERGAGAKEAKELPNLVKYKYDKLMNYPLPQGKKLTIGIPMVMNMYENLPFWAAFFGELGCSVVLSGKSSRDMYQTGQHTIPSDTVCYPAKLAHGHMVALLDKNVDVIFYPSMTYNIDEGISDNHYNCPVVAYYPELIESNMYDVSQILIKEHLLLEDSPFFYQRMVNVLKDYLPNVTTEETERGTKAGFKALNDFRYHIMEEGEKALDFAQQEGYKTVVLASRPYHIDPEINHGLDMLMTSLGYVLVTEDAIPYEHYKKQRNALNQWTYHARMYQAADFVVHQPNTEMVQLVSFGCGLDAITSDEVSDILRFNGKLYTQLKIDEINNLGATKIRMRSLLAAMDEREENVSCVLKK